VLGHGGYCLRVGYLVVEGLQATLGLELQCDNLEVTCCWILAPTYLSLVAHIVAHFCLVTSTCLLLLVAPCLLVVVTPYALLIHLSLML